MAEFDLTAEITAMLKEYTGDVMDKVDKAVTDCGKGLCKEIKSTSPKLTGDYSKGWRCEFSQSGRGMKNALVKNATDWQLTHLLEKPHKKRGHNGMTKPIPHIGPAAEKWTEEFERRCEEACKAVSSLGNRNGAIMSQPFCTLLNLFYRELDS